MLIASQSLTFLIRSAPLDRPLARPGNLVPHMFSFGRRASQVQGRPSLKQEGSHGHFGPRTAAGICRVALRRFEPASHQAYAMTISADGQIRPSPWSTIGFEGNRNVEFDLPVRHNVVANAFDEMLEIALQLA